MVRNLGFAMLRVVAIVEPLILLGGNAVAEPKYVNLPKGLKVDFYDEYMHIQKIWFTKTVLFIMLLFVIWLAGAVYMFAQEDVRLFVESIIGDGVLTSVLPIVLGLVFVTIIYSMVAMLVNKTHIFVSKDLMEVKIKPLIWFGRFKLASADIKKLLIVEHTRQNPNNLNKYKPTYEVHLVKLSGRARKIIIGLQQNEAKVIKANIEDYLGLETEVSE